MALSFEGDLLALARDVGRAPSIAEAWRTAAGGLTAMTGRPCGVAVEQGTTWTPAYPDADLADADLRLTIARPGSARAELRFGPLPESSARADVLRDPATQSLVTDAIGDAVSVVFCGAELALARAREQRLESFSRALVEVATTAALHRLIVETMARTVTADIGALAVPIPGERALGITATYGYPSVVVEHVRVAPGEAVLGRVFSTGQPILARDTSDTPGHARRRRYRGNSYLALPLTGGEGVLAVVALTDKADGSPFNEEDLTSLTSLAVPASLALAREQLRDRTNDLAHLATIDPLTALFNRRYFETRLEQEIQRQRRQFDDLALLMVDLDNFKELNDTQGHLVGDRVLREVADILRRAVRIFDVCARYGGEEFVILMPGANAQTAVRIAERIRRQVEQHFASGLRSGVPVSPTVSVGVSTASPSTSRETLIAQADAALFAAKSGGKNLVNVYPALTTP